MCKQSKPPFFKFCLLLFCLASLEAHAQNNEELFQSEGGMVGFGMDYYPDVVHHPLLLVADISWQVGDRNKNTFFSFYVEPQVNLVFGNENQSFEFGTNIGIRLHEKIHNDYLYQMIGAGPHYISEANPRQAQGFIFSDNIAVGYLKQLLPAKNIFLNMQLCFRHISNAGLNAPNGGVNNLIFLLGVQINKLTKRRSVR